MADSSVWGRTKIFRHQSHIRTGEAQTADPGSTGLISEHIWDGIWVNGSWGDRGRKERDEYSQSMIHVLDAKAVCEAPGSQGTGSWDTSLERAFEFLKPSGLVNEFSQFFELWLIFKKIDWVLLLALWSRGIAFSKVNNILSAQLWSTSLIFREHRKCPSFSSSVLMDFLMSEDLSFVWHLNYSFSTPTAA